MKALASPLVSSNNDPVYPSLSFLALQFPLSTTILLSVHSFDRGAFVLRRPHAVVRRSSPLVSFTASFLTFSLSAHEKRTCCLNDVLVKYLLSLPISLSSSSFSLSPTAKVISENQGMALI